MAKVTEAQMRVWLPRAGFALYTLLFLYKLVRSWPLGQKNPKIIAPPSVTADLLGIALWAFVVWLIIAALFWIVMLLLIRIGGSR